jgi:hypothetical protein
LGHKNSHCQETEGLGINHSYVINSVSWSFEITLRILAVTVVSPRMGSHGWPFAKVDPFPGADEDPLFHSEHVKDLYIKANPNYGGRSVLRCKNTADFK